MKNIKRITCVGSILTGLLLLAACSDPLSDISRAGSTQAGDDIRNGYSIDDTRESREDDSDFQWLTIYSESGTMKTIRVPICESEESEEPTRTPSFNVQTIISSGKPDSQSIVITIMGDGFTSTQQADFIVKATDAANYLISFYPFNLFSNLFTVYAVEVISPQSGVSRDPDKTSPMVANYFGSSFYGISGEREQRALEIKNYSLAKALQQPNTSVTVILCNSNTSGGTGAAGYAVSSICIDPVKDLDFRRTVTHELGHSFGGLADEYWYSGKDAPNMTNSKVTAMFKWGYWVNFDGIKVYPILDAGNPTGWFRPTKDHTENTITAGKCHMGFLSQDFCAVCSTELIRLMAIKSGKAGYLYNDLPDGTVEITGLSPGLHPTGKIIIPSRIDGTAIFGKTVTSIAYSAFKNQTGLSAVTIPNTVTSIENYAFYNTGLNSVTIPNTVTSVGENAFHNTGIWNNAATNSVVYADKWAIGCKGTVPGTLSLETDTVGIADYAFYLNYDITHVTIPDNVINIGTGAFFYAYFLESVILPAYVTTLKFNTFALCLSLENVTFSSLGYLKTIGDCAFYCSGITQMDIPSGVTKIGLQAFGNMYTNGMKMAELKNIALKDEAFMARAQGSSRDELAEISRLMRNVSSEPPLERVWIPLSVASIEAEAFGGCSLLTIYAQAASKPSGWDTDWNPDNRPVIWGSSPGGSYSGTSVRHPSSNGTILFIPSESGVYKFCFCDIDSCQPSTISITGVKTGSCSITATLTAGQTYTVIFSATPCGSKQGQFKIDKDCNPCPPC